MKVFSIAFLNFFKFCLFANFMFCDMAVMCRWYRLWKLIVIYMFSAVD